MHRTRLTAAALMSLLVLVPLAPAGAEELPAPPGAASSPTAREAQDPRPTDRIIVKLADDAAAPGATDSAVAESVDQAVTEEAPSQAGVITAEVVETTADGAKVVELGEAVEVTDLEAAAEELEADPAVEYAEADMVVTASAAAEANNGIGVTGVAPQARIMPVRVLGTCGSGCMSEVALGIRWASGEAVGVINLSLNFPGVCTKTFQDAITAAHRRGSVPPTPTSSGPPAPTTAGPSTSSLPAEPGTTRSTPRWTGAPADRLPPPTAATRAPRWPPRTWPAPPRCCASSTRR